MKYFLMSDIDIHQLNLGQLGNVKTLVENPFKKYDLCTSWTINAQ